MQYQFECLIIHGQFAQYITICLSINIELLKSIINHYRGPIILIPIERKVKLLDTTRPNFDAPIY